MTVKLNEKVLASFQLPDDVQQLILWDAELTGFGVAIGQNRRTFLVETRVNGKKRRKKIGVAGELHPKKGEPWTVHLARQEAKCLLGDMARGIDPNAETRLRREGP